MILDSDIDLFLQVPYVKHRFFPPVFPSALGTEQMDCFSFAEVKMRIPVSILKEKNLLF